MEGGNCVFDRQPTRISLTFEVLYQNLGLSYVPHLSGRYAGTAGLGANDRGTQHDDHHKQCEELRTIRPQ